jgi:hypothetical protein
MSIISELFEAHANALVGVLSAAAARLADGEA